jgi:hypothetical protein
MGLNQFGPSHLPHKVNGIAWRPSLALPSGRWLPASAAAVYFAAFRFLARKASIRV